MEKKTAVIIGEDGRLNSLLAREMIQRGVAAITLTGAEQALPQSGESCAYGSQEELMAHCERIAKERGLIDYLVCSVLADPVEHRGDLHHTDAQAWQEAKRGSVDMLYNISRILIAPMAKRGRGRVLFISSLGGEMCAAGQSVSSAMSAGTVMLMQSIAVEGGAQGISANALLLGPMEGCRGGIAADERLIAHIPQKRAGRAEEAVSTIIYTLLDAPDYFSGNALKLDGALSSAFMREW